MMTDDDILIALQIGTHVLVPKERFDELIKNTDFLRCLEAAGIDNTEAYSQGCGAFAEMYPEDDDFDEVNDTFTEDDELSQEELDEEDTNG